MNAKPKPEEIANAEPLTGLSLLRAPFPAHQVSKLPRETKKQTEDRKKDMDAGRWPAKCTVCGGLHHPNAVHLDYVGHAALTDRLLDADPAWSWAPAAERDGLPAFDQTGGLWIKLTVCGVSRLGYGHAAPKPGMDPGAREKEVIGDALRNAAMRFGAALDLWHKGDLHVSDEETPPAANGAEEAAINLLRGASADPDMFKAVWAKNKGPWTELLAPDAWRRVVAEMKRLGEQIATRQKADIEADPFREGGPGDVAGHGLDDPEEDYNSGSRSA